MAIELYNLDTTFNNSIDTFGTIVRVQLLTELDISTGRTKRTPRSYPIDIDAVTLGDEEVVFTAMPGGLTTIPKGSVIVYKDDSDNKEYPIRILEDVNSSNLTVSISKSPVTIAATVSAPDELVVFPMYELQGGQSTGIKTNDKEVETRTFESGIFSDAKKVMVGATADWSGIYPQDDIGLRNVIQPACKSSKELFVEILYPNGMSRYGCSYLKDYSETGKQDDVVMASWSFRFVSELYFKTFDGIII